MESIITLGLVIIGMIVGSIALAIHLGIWNTIRQWFNDSSSSPSKRVDDPATAGILSAIDRVIDRITSLRSVNDQLTGVASQLDQIHQNTIIDTSINKLYAQLPKIKELRIRAWQSMSEDITAITNVFNQTFETFDKSLISFLATRQVDSAIVMNRQHIYRNDVNNIQDTLDAFIVRGDNINDDPDQVRDFIVLNLALMENIAMYHESMSRILLDHWLSSKE